MKTRRFWTSLALAALLAGTGWAWQDITVTGGGEAADGLDLSSVAELFRTTKDTESFERALNDPDTGINNLDLDDDGQVDYIRVAELADRDIRVLVLQVPLAEDEFQDVATIEVEKKAATNVEVQVHGNVQVYGPNYYVRPTTAVFATAAFVSWLYRPNYVAYHSAWHWGSHPAWYRPWHPVHVTVYRARPVHVQRTVVYRTYTRPTVVSATRVYKTPATSVHVKKTLRQPTESQKQMQVRRTTVATGSGGFGRKTSVGKGETTVEHGRSVSHEDGDTTVKRGTRVNKGETTVEHGRSVSHEDGETTVTHGTKVSKGDKSANRTTEVHRDSKTKSKTTQKTKTKGDKTKTKTRKKKSKND